MRWLFSRTICAMTLLRDFYSQIRTQPCCFHPLGVYTNPPPPVPPFLLTLNQSPKEIAGSYLDICMVWLSVHTNHPCMVNNWVMRLLGCLGGTEVHAKASYLYSQSYRTASPSVGHRPGWQQPWWSGMHCTQSYTSSGGVADIVSAIMPLLSITLQLLFSTRAGSADQGWLTAIQISVWCLLMNHNLYPN